MKRFEALQKLRAKYFAADRAAMCGKDDHLFGYKLLMSANQSFNRSLYAPLTRTSLVCRPAVYFMRKVCMNRRPILRWVLSTGVAVQLSVLLCSVPLHAQSGLVPGMEDPVGGGHGPTTFNDKAPVPEQHVLTANHAPGDVTGVTRYSSGLPMAGVQVVILNADADVERFTVSASDGSYAFKNLKPGHYQLSAKIDGYAPSAILNIDVIPGQSVNSDISVKLVRGGSVSVASSASGYRASSSNYRAEPASLRVPDPQPTPGSSAEGTVRTTETTNAAAGGDAPKTSEASAGQPIPAAVADELAAMRRRIDELESELKGRVATESVQPPAPATPAVAAAPQAPSSDQAPAPPKLEAGQYVSTANIATYYKGDTDIPTHPDGWEPFSYADYTWLNGGGRQHDSPWSTKYFTPEFRADIHYMDDFNHPRDNTMGGATESFRSNEWQLEQLSLGGDIRIGHVRGRILTMFGLFATTTPRNDGSTSRGQWDLRNAYRYISEGWGGYHFDNVGHGLNIDAGIFVSYIGLFSYYNFDNWAYQPSFVSSNTPWFFNGLRIQYFPTAKLKIEPWIVNGWQSYARFNSKPGLGGQILWRPKPWLSLVFNNYGMGTDVLGSPFTSRIHTDDSVEIREYNHPEKFLDMMAMSFTFDAGCQYGGGQNCFNDKNGGIKTSFLGWMLYQRFQFAHDHYGLTLGGGQMNNPGRYLTLLPPINGADAISGSPYFTANLGDKAHMYDATATIDYMPSQWLTFRSEIGYRHSDVPYWSGRGGITPPGGLNNSFGNTGSPSLYVCTNGLASVADTTFTPSGAGFFQSSSVTPFGDNLGPQNSGGPVDQSCAIQMGSAAWRAWAPDLRKSQITATFAIMTRF
jgi:hypothetical protein